MTYSKLILGDCIEVLSKIKDIKVDAIICDPPYGTTRCSWDSVIPLDEMWKALNLIRKKNSPIILFSSQPFTSVLVSSNIKMFKYNWTWVKNKSTGFLNVKKQPLRTTEDICVFYENQCAYNPQKTSGHDPVHSYTKNTSDGETVGKTKIGISGGGSTERYPKNIVFDKVVNNYDFSCKRIHPTQKPVSLIKYMIETYTNREDVVLDFAAGSFTTGEACIKTGRSFIGIEKEEKYFLTGFKRIRKLIDLNEYNVNLEV